ncbi:MAG TPA: chorismate mutase [Gammaproteobacteria bacterium]|jgi:chorismate mutase/prephenate dehydrogenase|nr:chorismate mutase [Gammaproteobacteria bacterium]HET7587965.1 chorismate mutase [Gammaproteobacteria bacterium]
MMQARTDRPDTPVRLDDLRELIDAVDEALLELLAERARLVDQVAAVKRGEEIPMRIQSREDAIVAGVRKRAEELGLSPDIVEDIFCRILDESHRRMSGS